MRAPIPMPAGESLQEEERNPRTGWRTYLVAGVFLLGLGGLVALKLWILGRMLAAYFF